MGRLEPFIWAFAIVLGVVILLLALAISAKTLRDMGRRRPAARQDEEAIVDDYEDAVDELRDLIARSYVPGQSQPKGD